MSVTKSREGTDPGEGLELWKLPRLMEMWKIKTKEGEYSLLDFPHSHSRLENSHSTPFHSEFSTVPTAPATGSKKKGNRKNALRRAVLGQFGWTRPSQKCKNIQVPATISMAGFDPTMYGRF
jgi:hypothetical protein